MVQRSSMKNNTPVTVCWDMKTQTEWALLPLSASEPRMRRTPLARYRIMAVSMQAEDFPCLPSGPAEGMTCSFTHFTFILKQDFVAAFRHCRG